MQKAIAAIVSAGLIVLGAAAGAAAASSAPRSQRRIAECEHRL